jgi:hypothetical protein
MGAVGDPVDQTGLPRGPVGEERLEPLATALRIPATPPAPREHRLGKQRVQVESGPRPPRVGPSVRALPRYLGGSKDPALFATLELPTSLPC